MGTGVAAGLVSRNLDPGDVRQLQVEDDHVGPGRGGDADRLATSPGGRHHLVAGLFEEPQGLTQPVCRIVAGAEMASGDSAQQFDQHVELARHDGVEHATL